MDSVLDRLTVSAVTMPADVSPRKPDLVGLLEIRDLLTSLGKVNQKTGKPLSNGRVAVLLSRPDFPNPVYGTLDSKTRLWRRSDVIRWAEGWDQTAGYPKGKPRTPRPKKDG